MVDIQSGRFIEIHLMCFHLIYLVALTRGGGAARSGWDLVVTNLVASFVMLLRESVFALATGCTPFRTFDESTLHSHFFSCFAHFPGLSYCNTRSVVSFMACPLFDTLGTKSIRHFIQVLRLHRANIHCGKLFCSLSQPPILSHGETLHKMHGLC
jgi:hypothetical protein